MRMRFGAGVIRRAKSREVVFQKAYVVSRGAWSADG
jgi:hypothetical protein